VQLDSLISHAETPSPATEVAFSCCSNYDYTVEKGMLLPETGLLQRNFNGVVRSRLTAAPDGVAQMQQWWLRLLSQQDPTGAFCCTRKPANQSQELRQRWMAPAAAI
jgi:hypothetical protein